MMYVLAGLLIALATVVTFLVRECHICEVCESCDRTTKYRPHPNRMMCDFCNELRDFYKFHGESYTTWDKPQDAVNRYFRSIDRET
jgi:hypothetical protein